MEIILTELQIKELQKYATANDLTPTQYATNIITSWLNEHIKSGLIDKLKLKSNEELDEIVNKKEK